MGIGNIIAEAVLFAPDLGGHEEQAICPFMRRGGKYAWAIYDGLSCLRLIGSNHDR